MDWQIFWTVLGGAFGGALIASLTSIIVTRLNHRNDQESWLRDQRQILYIETSTENHELYLAFNRLIDRVRRAHTFRTVPQDPPLGAGELELLDIEITQAAEATQNRLDQLKLLEFRHRILASAETTQAFAKYLKAMSKNVTTASSTFSDTPNAEEELLRTRSSQVQAWKLWEDTARSDLGVE